MPLKEVYKYNTIWVPLEPERRVRRKGCDFCIKHLAKEIKPKTKQEWDWKHASTSTKTISDSVWDY